MIGETSARARLCPHCANSISADAAECVYCKAEFSAQFDPPWLKRDELSSERPTDSENHSRLPVPKNFFWIAAILIVGFGVFFTGSYIQRSELSLASQAHLKQLQAKDQAIKNHEGQLAQTRQQLIESNNQLAEIKTQLADSRKELSLIQQRLGVATAQVDRLNASRSAVPARAASRAPANPQPAAARQPAVAGVYETTRATSVQEDPSSTSRVISKIDRGTRINVVSSAGSWLEVRSKRGNPPGYVRSDDARRIGAAN